MVDGKGDIVNRYQYDAFGNTVEAVEKVQNRFRYAGEQYDQVTGQYYLRARFYNPVVGRFTQEDTYRGDGLNLYSYVSNNPIKYIDPSGYCAAKSNPYTPPTSFRNDMSDNDKRAYDNYWNNVARGIDKTPENAVLIGSENTWNEFLKHNPSSDLNKSAQSYIDLITEQSPWPEGFTPVPRVLKGGDTFNMVLDVKQDSDSPGGFGIIEDVTSRDFARNNMAIKSNWKDDCGKVVTYKVKDGVELKTLSGPIGPQIDLDADKYLPGDMNVTQLDLFNGLGRVNRLDYIEAIEETERFIY